MSPNTRISRDALVCHTPRLEFWEAKLEPLVGKSTRYKKEKENKTKKKKQPLLLLLYCAI